MVPHLSGLGLTLVLAGVILVAPAPAGPVGPGRATLSRAPAKSAEADHVGFLAVAEAGKPVQAIPYCPRAGDIVLYDDFNRLYHFVYFVAGTGPPTHVAMVIADNGRPALLELTGPTVIRAKVTIMDVEKRLRAYPGSIIVRRIRQPLPPEDSAALTQFAHDQEGKAFAYRRIALQITPFRARTGLRHYCFGHTYFNRHRWICSEMVAAAACRAHILDPQRCTANAIYPRDLAFDEYYNLSEIYYSPVPWASEAAAAIEKPTPRP